MKTPGYMVLILILNLQATFLTAVSKAVLVHIDFRICTTQYNIFLSWFSFFYFRF